MSQKYAFADLHGRFDLMQKAFDAIEAHAGTRPAFIVTLGDYVDRGPQSRQIIEALMAGPRREGDTLISLKGNHEAMMVEVLGRPTGIPWWLGNGGGQTLMSYGQKPGERANPAVVPREHARWLDALPTTFVDEHRVFVHAGVDETMPLDGQKEKTLLWMLYPEGYAGGHGQRHVVHGHEQFADGPKLFAGRSDLDTFAWFTGRLVVGVFDDDIPGGPVELIEVIGEPISRQMFAFESEDA